MPIHSLMLLDVVVVCQHMNGRPRTTELVGLNHAASVPSMHHAHACLRLTTPSLNLSYPEDAWDHYDEIQRVMQRWLQSAPGFERHGAAGYRGPWIENIWISHFERLAARARSRRRPLHSVFGPFVPLLVPFVDQWVQRASQGYRYPVGSSRRSSRCVPAWHTLLSARMTRVDGQGELPMWRIPNVLVLSAGGYGHARAAAEADGATERRRGHGASPAPRLIQGLVAQCARSIARAHARPRRRSGGAAPLPLPRGPVNHWQHAMVAPRALVARSAALCRANHVAAFGHRELARTDGALAIVAVPTRVRAKFLPPCRNRAAGASSDLRLLGHPVGAV